RLTTGTHADGRAALSRLDPREVLISGEREERLRPMLADGALVTRRAAWEFDSALARDALQSHFGIASLDGFGLEASDDCVIGAAGALLRYLRELQPAGVPHIARPVIERSGATMPLDEMTRRNLELVESLRGGTDGTLL